jgi:hypothetical protein
VNGFFDVAVNQILEGGLDLGTTPLMVRAYVDAYFNPHALTLADLSMTPTSAPAVALTGRSVSNRTLLADPVTFPAVLETEYIRSLVIYRGDTGGVVAYIDQRPDLAPLSVQGNGGAIQVRWAGTSAIEVIKL